MARPQGGPALPSVQIWQFLVIDCEIGPRALFSIMEVS